MSAWITSGKSRVSLISKQTTVEKHIQPAVQTALSLSVMRTLTIKTVWKELLAMNIHQYGAGKHKLLLWKNNIALPNL